MFYYVYVLRSEKDGNLYIGETADLRERLKQHNQGLVRSTKTRQPIQLIYYEAYLSKEEALRKEKFYKSGRGHEVLAQMLYRTLGNRAEVAKVVKAVV